MSDFDISAQIMKELGDYSNTVIDAVNAAAEETSKQLQKELKQESPKKKNGKNAGRYSRGWRIRQLSKLSTQSKFVVYNATDYQLTHLLEHGHEFVGRAIRGGTLRAKPYPHIEPAEEKAVDQFLEKVEKAIREVGK